MGDFYFCNVRTIKTPTIMETQNDNLVNCEAESSKSIRKKKKKRHKISRMEYLLKKHEEDNKLSNEVIQALRDIRVQLNHEVPPQHQIEKNAGTHAPTRDEKQRFKELVELKQGPYTQDEDRIIRRNWRKFCKRHNWKKENYKPFLFMRHGSLKIMPQIEERRKFVQFLARDLPNRMLYSVYHRFRNIYETHVQGKFDSDEDELILEHLEKNPYTQRKTAYADLAKVLNRTRASVWRRYQVLLGEKGTDRIKSLQDPLRIKKRTIKNFLVQLN